MSGRVIRTLIALAAGSTLVLTACSENTENAGSGPGTGQQTVTVDKVDSIASQLPDKIKNANKLVVGVNVPYSPNEFKDSTGKIIGFDVDLLDAVAKVLGVTAEYRESDFEKIIPSIQAGTYDVGMSSFTDTKEREQSVDFTTYFNAGVQWAQQAGKSIDPNNACGKKVAVQATTIEDTEEVPAKSDKCKAEGKPEIEKVKFDRQDDATNALVLGRVDAMSADSPVTLYAIKQSGGKIEAAGSAFDSAPYGWPVQKGSPLAAVLQKALQHLIDDGTYQKICANWGLESGMIEKSVVNGAAG